MLKTVVCFYLGVQREPQAEVLEGGYMLAWNVYRLAWPLSCMQRYFEGGSRARLQHGQRPAASGRKQATRVGDRGVKMTGLRAHHVQTW